MTAVGSRSVLVEVDWVAVLRQFHSTRQTSEVHAALRRAGVDPAVLRDLGDAVVARVPPHSERPSHRASLDLLWRQAAAAGTGSTFLLAFGLYAECQWCWELTSGSATLLELVADVVASWVELPTRDLLSVEELALTQLLVDHLADVEHFLEMENGLNCSCPVATAGAAARVVSSSRRLLAALPAPGGPWQAPRRVLETVLRTHADYFEGVRRGADAVLASLTDPAGAVPLVLSTADDLDLLAATPPLADDVYQSELRSQTVGLRALAHRLRTTELGRLQFPGLTVTYVYPFTSSGPADLAVLGALRGHPDWGSRADPWPVAVEELDLSDVWSHGRQAVLSDAPLAPVVYEGVSLLLPPVELVDTAGYTHEPYRLEVRFSAFGNHHLRITGPVHAYGPDGPEDAGYHELNQAVRRGSTFMGDEQIRLGDAPALARTLTALAGRVIAAVPAWVRDAGVPEPFSVYADPAVDAHVVVRVDEAEVVGEGGVRRATGDELMSALGPLLMVPVERTASGLEEWLRYAGPTAAHEVASFLGRFAPEDSLAVQTTRTTCLYAPGQPSWSLLGTLEMVEFVVSVRALVRQWEREVQSAVDEATRLLSRRLDGAVMRAGDLRAQRLRLASTAANVRRQRSLLHAEDLARSAGHRQTLDLLLLSSGAVQLEADLDRRVSQLDALYATLGEDALSSEQEREQTYRRRVELALFVVALFSFSDLIGLGNDLLFGDGVPRPAAALEVAVFVAWVVGCSVWVSRRRAP